MGGGEEEARDECRRSCCAECRPAMIPRRAAISARAREFASAAISAISVRARASLSHTMRCPVSISSTFDAGNIEVVEERADGVQLKIKPDPYTELEEKSHFQWFAFRAVVSAAAAQPAA